MHERGWDEDPSATRWIESALLRELAAARDRVAVQVARRQRLERELAVATAAEEAERRSLQVLESIAGGGEAATGSDGGRNGADETLLAGAPLRSTIMRVALRDGRIGLPTHWRAWYGWLRDAGFDAAGKKPEATFLTQLTRSPLVGRGHQDGVYVLDLDRFVDVQRELKDLHERLTRLPPPDQLSMLGETRAQRQRLQTAIGRCERALSEMWEVLRNALPDDWPDGVDPSPDRVVAWWTRARDSQQGRLPA